MSSYRIRGPSHNYRTLTRRAGSYLAKKVAFGGAIATGALAIKRKRPARKIGNLRGARRKLRLNQRATLNSQGGSFSSFNYGARKLKLPYSVIKALSKNYYMYNSALRCSSGVGQQSFTLIGNIFENATCANMASKITGYTATQRTIYLSCSWEVMITNQALGSVRLWVYDIIARRDLTSSTTQDPVTTLYNSYADETGGNTTDYKIPGITPFSNDLFTQYFKVLKITQIDLSQGQTHIHKGNFTLNKIIDKEIFSNSGTGLKGQNCFVMLQQHGVPSNDTTTSQIKWCNPSTPVDPIYIPGLNLTGSSPFKT